MALFVHSGDVGEGSRGPCMWYPNVARVSSSRELDIGAENEPYHHVCPHLVWRSGWA
jgi:hypothetical protein